MQKRALYMLAFSSVSAIIILYACIYVHVLFNWIRTNVTFEIWLLLYRITR